MMKKKEKPAMPTIAVVSDMGHSLLKIGVREVNGDWSYSDAPHALHKIPRVKWEHIADQTRGQANAVDYVQSGQDYYIIGESAERYGHAQRRVGAARYERDYIGVQTMGMVARIAPCSEAEVVILALHPPADVDFRRELRDSLIGTWDMQLGDGRECLYHVRQVVTTAEPVAGFMNAVLDNKLREDRSLTGGEVLVIDLGGGTTTVAPVLPGGSVDYGRAASFSMGILNVMYKLEENLKAAYREEFKRARQIPPDRLRRALMDDTFTGGGRVMPCADEVRAAKAELLAEIEQMYYNGTVGGAMRFDAIVLTGGGSVVLGQDLRDMLMHDDVRFADRDTEHIHYANVKGAGKMFDLLVADSVIEL